jgi:chitinase
VATVSNTREQAIWRWAMKSKNDIKARIVICLLGAAIVIGLSVASSSNVYAQSMWVSAYYGGWAQGCGYVGNMQADKIDYSAVTHIIHFAIQPLPDGSIDDTTLCITPENSASLISHAHAAGKKVLVALGGENTESAFLSATNSTNRQKFINNLINFITTRGYDGIDLDWEPITPSSISQVKTFIIELRAALDAMTPRPFFTAAVFCEPDLFAQLQDKFDQINIMTYDLNGDWLNGSWFNAPTYDGGYWFSASGPAPSANGLVDMFISAGLNPAKLGIGIGFYGYVAKGGKSTPTDGVTAPGQLWTSPPTKTAYTYSDIMDKFFNPANYRYDSAAGAAYLSYNMTGSAEDMFITYDDESSILEKINYVRNKAIGGVIIFQLGGGWRPNAPVPDNLLQAVKDAVIQTTNQAMVPSIPILNSPSNGASGVSTSTTLKWNSSAGANSYTLQVSKSPEFIEPIVNQDNLTATFYNLSGLSYSTTYYWRVRATNTSGSEWSNTWSFTTTTQGTILTGFTGNSLSAGALLTWQTATEYNNKGFDIQRRLSTSKQWSKIGFVAGAGTSYTPKAYSFTDTKTPKGSRYIYRLKQLNTNGSFIYSSEVTVKK